MTSRQRAAGSGQISDPIAGVTLREELRRLVADHGKEEVRACLEDLTRRQPRGEATRGEMERLSELIKQLPRESAAEFNPHAFLQRQIGAGIPAAISIEILERVVSVNPRNVWALINKIMGEDYPGYRWGRS